MYNDQILDNWLDKRANDIVANLGKGSPLTAEDMLVLVLKAQTNHFNHLDVELREDMKQLHLGMTTDMQQLRVDMTTDMQQLRVDMTTDMKQLRVDMATDMQQLRQDMDKRFEQVDKRFEQVDRRFEQVDKRFDTLIGRIDRFMIWSFATTLSVGGIVIAAVKFL